jgi:hypothetical protein
MTQKFGVIFIFFYAAAAVVVAIPDIFSGGAADPGKMAAVYPPNVPLPASAQIRKLAHVYGLPENGRFAASNPENVKIISYSASGVEMSVDGGAPEAASFAKALKYLGAPASSQANAWLAPLNQAFDFLLNIHLGLLRRLDETLAAWKLGDFLSLILAKIAIAVIYCGVVPVIWHFLARYDAISSRKAGFSLIYISLAVWPVYVIALSLIGVSLLDVLRHLPASLTFLNPPILIAWGAILAWPILLTLLSLLDILSALCAFRLSSALSHAMVLTAGLASIPMVAAGILFAILAALLYVAYRTGRRLIRPARSRF